MLSLGVGDGIESADADNLADAVSATIVGVGICSQDAAEICLQPQVV
jgi:hypothetical protein